MSKTPRNLRAKSGGVRPLGSVHLTQGSLNHSSKRNDPALLVNQLHLNNTATIDPDKDELREKEFKEKERKLLDQIGALEKLIAQLRQQLKEKTAKCSKLEDDIALQAKKHQEELSQSEEAHLKTKRDYESAMALAEERNILLQKNTEYYEEKIKAIIKEYEDKLAALAEAKDKEIQDRDEKMKLLKQRMAASLGKNSQERQQQLEELKRDLMKQAQEARDLQQKLKLVQLKSCDNCKKLQDRLEEKTLQLRLKEKSLAELQNIGKKMQVQLNQQGVLIQKWEERAEGN